MSLGGGGVFFLLPPLGSFSENMKFQGVLIDFKSNMKYDRRRNESKKTGKRKFLGIIWIN